MTRRVEMVACEYQHMGAGDLVAGRMCCLEGQLRSWREPGALAEWQGAELALQGQAPEHSFC